MSDALRTGAGAQILLAASIAPLPCDASPPMLPAAEVRPGASTTPCVTSEELHILQHSLGVDQYGRGDQYRNHFVTGEGSVDHPHCNALVLKGFMGVSRNRQIYGGMDGFWVTDAGRVAMAENSPAPPKLSRAQKRYQHWLAADCELPFGEWLKTEQGRAA